MIPVISFVGRSNSGKTTYLIKLISELKKRGYKVAVIKHHHGDFNIDHPGKDTWRHAEAGADVVMISSPNKMAMIQKNQQELSLEDLICHISNVDLIITEGYKREEIPKIEVLRSAVSKDLVCAERDLIAIVTDVQMAFSVSTFDLENVNKLADFLVEKLIATC